MEPKKVKLLKRSIKFFVRNWLRDDGTTMDTLDTLMQNEKDIATLENVLEDIETGKIDYVQKKTKKEKPLSQF